MDFDKYEYLKKRVKETNGSSRKETPDKEAERERREKGYRRERSFDEFDEEDRERKRSSKKSRIVEKESDRDKERERRRYRDRERDRDRERSSGHRSQHRDSERRSSRDKDRDRNRDRRRRESDREREKERERIEREQERERSRSRSKMQERKREENRRYKDKKEAVQPEPAPKTVFAYQIRLQANERDVFEFFSKAGKVRDVKLIMYQNKSRGVGYIEFNDPMSVPRALALSGHLFMGQPIMVKPAEAEKNLVRSTATGGSVAGPYGATDRKLYIGKLQFNMTESRLKQIFEAFGPVELAQLPTDPETGHCKGFGFIQFAKLEHSKAAQSLDGKLEIAGRTITISSVADHVAAQDSDDDGGGGLAQSKASGIASSVGLPSQRVIINPAPPEEPIGTPSECLLLKNVFDPSTVEMEPEFDLDMRDDVAEECSKYGKVKHAHVDSSSAGFVYLRFVGVEAASRAQQAMHKRLFGLRLISAIFLQPYEYDAKFPGSA